MSRITTTIRLVKRILPATTIAILLATILSGAALPQGRNINLAKDDAGLSLEWRGIPEATYRVERRTNLLAGDWEKTTLPEVVADSETTTVNIATSDASSQFFRVLFPTPVVESCDLVPLEAAEGIGLVVNGTYFYEGDQIRVDGVPLNNVVFVNHNQLRGELPALSRAAKHTVEIVSGQNANVLAALSDALEVPKMLLDVNAQAAVDFSNIEVGSTVPAADWDADRAYSGGTISTTTAPINTSKTSFPAPQAVYQSYRFGNYDYNLTSLTPNTQYELRLHFVEPYFTAANSRVFNVSANSVTLLSGFDVFSVAGGKDVAVAKDFVALSDAAGKIKLSFVPSVNNAILSGIQYKASPPPPVFSKIEVGSTTAVADWGADRGFTGGTISKKTDPIDLSKVTSPAPLAVYQSIRFGNFNYNLTSLTPNTKYDFRFHFVETYFTAINSRVFNVTANGTTLLSGFDVFKATGGKNIAIIKDFVVQADAAGKIALGFVPTVDNAILSGIEYKVSSAPDEGWVAGWGNPSWRDEFDGPTVDTTKWIVKNNDYLSYDWAYLKKEAVTIDTTAKTLKITASLLPTPKVTYDDPPKNTIPRTRRYQTGYITATKQAEFGRWEMRAKIPTIRNISSGVWPAFWHRALGGLGEIDTMEAWGSPATTHTPPAWWPETSSFTVHEKTSGGTNKLGCNFERTLNPGATSYNTASTGFHTWTMEKTPTSIKAYLDNQLIVTLTPTSHPWAFGPQFTGHPLDTRINLQMGDTYWMKDPQPGVNLVLPAVFEVDYVRYWPLP